MLGNNIFQDKATFLQCEAYKLSFRDILSFLRRGTKIHYSFMVIKFVVSSSFWMGFIPTLYSTLCEEDKNDNKDVFCTLS